ncbi:MAG: hypothetical protein IPP97_27435 [Candidatus Obscuribacter sp.]|nr:hypothetical protein [Candidatus Obscuribacter sp.]MBP6350020.1 hypothetical protein [Candidatus Obscuribacter sp.]
MSALYTSLFYILAVLSVITLAWSCVRLIFDRYIESIIFNEVGRVLDDHEDEYVAAIADMENVTKKMNDLMERDLRCMANNLFTKQQKSRAKAQASRLIFMSISQRDFAPRIEKLTQEMCARSA